MRRKAVNSTTNAIKSGGFNLPGNLGCGDRFIKQRAA